MKPTLTEQVKDELSSYQSLLVMVESTRTALKTIQTESKSFDEIVAANPNPETMTDHELLIQGIQLQKKHAEITMAGLRATGPQLQVQLDKVEQAVLSAMHSLEEQIEQLENDQPPA